MLSKYRVSDSKIPLPDVVDVGVGDFVMVSRDGIGVVYKIMGYDSSDFVDVSRYYGTEIKPDLWLNKNVFERIGVSMVSRHDVGDISELPARVQIEKVTRMLKLREDNFEGKVIKFNPQA